MNIALIGIMGCGKTTIGQLLKGKLNGFTFVDTDDLIVKSENHSINEIFSDNGEDYFREIETKILKDVLKNDNQIISTGGGIIKSQENINILKEKSIMIYLKTDINELVERLKNDNQRPLLKNEDIKTKLATLLEEREPKYQQAQHIINTTNKTPDIIVKEIIETVCNK